MARMPSPPGSWTLPRRAQSIRIPAVRKSKNLRVQRHDIQGQCAMNPPAQRRAFAAVFFESQSAKPLGKHGVLGIGTNLRDDVHVVGSAYGRGGRIVDQQTCCAAANKDDFRKELAQPLSRQFQQFKIRIWHRWASPTFASAPDSPGFVLWPARYGEHPPRPAIHRAAHLRVQLAGHSCGGAQSCSHELSHPHTARLAATRPHQQSFSKAEELHSSSEHLASARRSRQEKHTVLP